MKLLRNLCVCVATLLLIYTAVSYLRVEYLTWKHGDEFRSVLDDWGKISPGRTLTLVKVFQYGNRHATIYVLDEKWGGTMAVYMNFRRTGDIWTEDEMKPGKLIWSSGSADGWTWPPYWR